MAFVSKLLVAWVLTLTGITVVVGIAMFAEPSWGSRTAAPVCAPVDPVPRDPVIQPPGDLVGLRVEPVVEGLGFLTDMVELPAWGMYLVSEKPGRILAVRDGAVLDPPVLDITDRVLDDWNERGLLTITLHPDFIDSCEMFLFYTDLQGHSNFVSVLVEGTEHPSISPDSIRTVLYVRQDHQYHQSGSMEFGPDGYLWLTVGDGGLLHPENAQDPGTLKGSVLRLDISRRPYGIPDDNPFVGSSDGLPEVWAYGLRNPWRVSIDHETRTVYLPDPGYAEWEEVNIVPIERPASNFGWPVMEGLSCFRAETCLDPGERPTFSYHHDGSICAIVGGQVYRGSRIPEVDGHFFYADFCRGWVKSFFYDGGRVTVRESWPGIDVDSSITSFAGDLSGELYVTTVDGGLWRIVAERG